MADTLFDLAGVESAPSWPGRLREMHNIHGEGPAGALCGACRNLLTVSRARDYSKCYMSRVTSGPGSDWRKSWPACGAFAEGDQVTVYRG